VSDTREDRIRRRLAETLTPLECRLEDESALHAGHPGAASGGGHFRLHLVSGRFEGLNRVARHRLVYDCLRDLMQSEIHALAITALAPSEITK
jgi:BolA protein